MVFIDFSLNVNTPKSPSRPLSFVEILRGFRQICWEKYPSMETTEQLTTESG